MAHGRASSTALDFWYRLCVPSAHLILGRIGDHGNPEFTPEVGFGQKGETMDPNLYYAMLAAAGIVVSGGVTFWAGSRLLRFGARDSGGDAARKPHEAGRSAPP